MGTCDCAVVQERVIVPEAVAVKESVVVPDTVTVKATVSVPVEVRIERMPAYHPDPLWPNLESCPAGHIWAVCYSFDEGDYDICFSQTYVEGKVDWGDGESEDILNRYARASHHKFARGTGRPDSRGREFWLVDIAAEDKSSGIYGGLTFSRYGNNSYNTLDIDGRNGIVALCIGEGLKFQVTVSEEYIHPLLEYVRVKGDEVWKPVSFGLIYSVKKVRYNEKARVEYLIGSPVPASYFDFPFRIEHCRYFANVSYLGNSRIDREELNFSTCELSSTNYNSNPNRTGISSIANNTRFLEVLRMPKLYDRCTQMNDFISNSNIRRIEFQPGDSLANCKNIIRFANSCTLLEEVENFPGDLGKNVENVDCWDIFSYCYSLRQTEVNFPYAKMRRVSFPGTDTRRSVPISRLVFHPDSPFDQKGDANHINIKYCRFERKGLVELFELLPDFSGGTTRQIDITGNPGAEELTEEERQIATDKNWIIVG